MNCIHVKKGSKLHQLFESADRKLLKVLDKQMNSSKFWAKYVDDYIIDSMYNNHENYIKL